MKKNSKKNDERTVDFESTLKYKQQCEIVSIIEKKDFEKLLDYDVDFIFLFDTWACMGPKYIYHIYKYCNNMEVIQHIFSNISKTEYSLMFNLELIDYVYEFNIEIARFMIRKARDIGCAELLDQYHPHKLINISPDVLKLYYGETEGKYSYCFELMGPQYFPPEFLYDGSKDI